MKTQRRSSQACCRRQYFENDRFRIVKNSVLLATFIALTIDWTRTCQLRTEAFARILKMTQAVSPLRAAAGSNDVMMSRISSSMSRVEFIEILSICDALQRVYKIDAADNTVFYV
jgi:hypothetical protein